MALLGEAYVGQSMGALGDTLASSNPVEAKNAYLGILQLLTDGLCASSWRFWQDASAKRALLDEILSRGAPLIGACYTGSPVEARAAVDAMLPLLPAAAAHASGKVAVLMHLTGREEQVWRLHEHVLEDGHAYDTVCGIASSGLEPMLLVAPHLGAQPLVLCYSQRRRNSRVHTPLPTHRYLSEVKGKRVLILDDTISTGRSMFACMSALRDAGATLVHGGAALSGNLVHESMFARYGVRKEGRWYVA